MSGIGSPEIITSVGVVSPATGYAAQSACEFNHISSSTDTETGLVSLPLDFFKQRRTRLWSGPRKCSPRSWANQAN